MEKSNKHNKWNSRTGMIKPSISLQPGMTPWHAGTCMLGVADGQGYHGDILVMNDTYLFLQPDIDPSASSGEYSSACRHPIGADFPGHRAKVKNKTTCMSASARKLVWTVLGSRGRSLTPGGCVEMSEAPGRRLLMSEHVAGSHPGHADAWSRCVRGRWSTPRPPPPPAPPSPPLPPRAAGKLIVSVIDCRGRSGLSSG